MKDKCATLDGTEKFFRFHPIHHEKKTLFNGIYLSRMGVGTYLGDLDEKTDLRYRKSLISAVQHGVNVIDTAVQYRCQRSEKILADVLKELEDLGIDRSQLFISTKGGYIPHHESSKDYEHSIRVHYVDKGIIDPRDIIQLNHCVSPSFLRYEIDLSLKHMQIDCIDLYYIHNPEMVLTELSQVEFYHKMERVFFMLEEQVKLGKIKSYGLATWNGFRLKADAQGLLILKDLVEIAKKVGGENHHFKAIQFPFNLVMTEAKTLANQPKNEEEKQSIFAAAASENISVFVSAPFMEGRVLKLPQRIFDIFPHEDSRMLKALQFVLSTPLVCSAMVGMTSSLHVHEDTKTLSQSNWTLEDYKNALQILNW